MCLYPPPSARRPSKNTVRRNRRLYTPDRDQKGHAISDPHESGCADLVLRALHASDNKVPPGSVGAAATSQDASLSGKLLAGIQCGFPAAFATEPKQKAIHPATTIDAIVFIQTSQINRSILAPERFASIAHFGEVNCQHSAILLVPFRRRHSLMGEAAAVGRRA